MESGYLSVVEDLASAVTALQRGVVGVIKWQSARTERMYEQFISSANSGGVFPENAEAMTAEDLYAIFKAIEIEMEEHKAPLYGLLARNIALGKVGVDFKRHYIKTLQSLSVRQMEGLRALRVVSLFAVRPSVGIGRIAEGDLLAKGGVGRMDEAVYEQFALVESKKLTEIGANFVDSCFSEGDICPEQAGLTEWLPGQIHVFCNELERSEHFNFIGALESAAHGEAIRMTHSRNTEQSVDNLIGLRPLLIVKLWRDRNCDPSGGEDRINRILQRGARLLSVCSDSEYVRKMSEYSQSGIIGLEGDGGSGAISLIIECFKELHQKGAITRLR